jgi:hypothetical protein
MRLGRNQTIAVTAYGLGLVATYALVWVGRLSGLEWASFLTPYLGVGVATILGASAAVKIGEAVGSGSRPASGQGE